MSTNLTVSNRQRKISVNLSDFEHMAEKLRRAVFTHLLSSPPEHLDDETLGEMRERGLFSIALVSDRQIRVLNKDWMGKDRPTDVLSFPLELDAPPAELPWEVGEIILSLEKAQAQAIEYGHTFERETAFLLVHGFLHVLGFDHMEPEEERDMFARQKQILNSAGFQR